ncbi:MAG: hypothetical protein Q8O87_00585 [bacterium]|nr:hypothetical protein [bacterium]
MANIGLRAMGDIRFGTGLKSASEFIDALNQGGCRVDITSETLLDSPDFRIALAKKLSQVRIAIVSVGDLGFGSATLSLICARAKMFDLELCPAEIAPQVCLQYGSLRYPGDVGVPSFYIAMKSLYDDSCFPWIFHITKYRGSPISLCAEGSDASRIWQGEYLFAFVKLK